MDKPIGLRINEVGKLFKKKVKEISIKKGLNSTFFDVIHYLDRSGNKGATQSELCEFLRLKAPTISITIQNMEALGYLKKEKDSFDSRKVAIYMTKQGLEFAKEVKSIFMEVETMLNDALSEEELKYFNNIILKLKNTLEVEK